MGLILTDNKINNIQPNNLSVTEIIKPRSLSNTKK